MAILTTALIAAGIGAAGQTASGLFGNKARKKAATTAHNRNRQNWKEQNEYNDPSQQMARLKAAGLNPNMVYGTGTQAAGIAGAPAAAPQANIQNIPMPNPLDMLGKYESIKSAQAQQDLAKSAENKNLSQIAINMTRNAILGDQAVNAPQFYLNQATNMYNQQRISNQQRAMSEIRLKNLGEIFRIEMQEKAAQAEYKAITTDWAKNGLTQSSDTVLMLTYAIMKENGEDPKNTMLAIQIAKEVALLATGLGIGKLMGGRAPKSPTKSLKRINTQSTKTNFNAAGKKTGRTVTRSTRNQ